MWYCDTGEMKMFPGKFRKNEYIFFVMHFHWSWNTYKMKDTVIKTSEPNLLLKKKRTKLHITHSNLSETFTTL